MAWHAWHGHNNGICDDAWRYGTSTVVSIAATRRNSQYAGKHAGDHNYLLRYGIAEAELS